MNGSNYVSWRDYQGVDGFGTSTIADLQEMRKALTAGNNINAPSSFVPGDGFALRIESLENTLANTTFRAEHPRMWKVIPKRPAYNVIEEFNQITSYGEGGQPAWVAEGALPSETDSIYTRNYREVKFLGTLRKVSHVMSAIRPAHGDVVTAETIAGTMYLLEQIERGLFEGDSSIEPLEWDGLDAQITAGAPAANIIDLRGAALTEDDLIDAALTVQDAPNYGRPTHLFLNPKVKADLVKTFFPKSRYDLFSKPDAGGVGLDVSYVHTPAGDVQFESDVFIRVTPGVGVATGDSARRPAQPVSITAAAATSASTSLFVASDAGNYFYQVVAVNSYGKSAPRAMAAAVAVVASDRVTLTVTPSDDRATYYEIYRTAAGGAVGTAKLIKRVRNTTAGAAATITDDNETLPNTSSAYMFQVNSDNMHFAQLAPMVKIPLATVDPSIRWMQLLYGTPIVRSPGRNVIFRNVGRASGFVGSV